MKRKHDIVKQEDKSINSEKVIKYDQVLGDRRGGARSRDWPYPIEGRVALSLHYCGEMIQWLWGNDPVIVG